MTHAALYDTPYATMERTTTPRPSLFIVPAAKSFHRTIIPSNESHLPLRSPQCSGFSTKQPPGHPKARNSQEDAMVKVSKNSRVLLDNPFRKLQDVQASRPLISRPMPLSVRTTHQNNKPISRKELPQVSLRPSLPKCSSANSTIRGASSTPMLHQYNPECSLKPIPRRSSIGHVLASSPSEAVDGDVDTRRIAATRAHSQEKLKPIRIRVKSDSKLLNISQRERTRNREEVHARTLGSRSQDMLISSISSTHVPEPDRGTLDKMTYHDSDRFCGVENPLAKVLTTDSNNCVHNESSFHPENLDERNPDPTSHGRSRVVDNQTHSFKKIGNDYPSIPLIPDEDSSVPVEYCRRTPIPQEYQPSMIRNCDEGQCPFGACESHFDDYSTPSGSMTDTDSRIHVVQCSFGSASVSSQCNGDNGPSSLDDSIGTTSSFLYPSTPISPIIAPLPQEQVNSITKTGIHATIATIGRKFREKSRQTFQIGTWLQKLHSKERSLDEVKTSSTLPMQDHPVIKDAWQGSVRSRR